MSLELKAGKGLLKIFENHLKHFPWDRRQLRKETKAPLFFFSPDPTIFSRHNWPFLLRPQRISGTRLFLKDYKDCLDIGGCVQNRQSRFRPGNRWETLSVLAVSVSIISLLLTACLSFLKGSVAKIHSHTSWLQQKWRRTPSPAKKKKWPPPPPRRRTLWYAEAARWRNSWRFYRKSRVGGSISGQCCS